MRTVRHLLKVLLPLLAVAAWLWPQAAGAQAFTADYGLVRVAPMYFNDARFSGAGLSISGGRNWFAEVGAGRTAPHISSLGNPVSSDVLSVGGGYRWADGQSLSLQVIGGHGVDRLGLSVSYDWPRYFVRLSYDSKFNLVPQDSLRFSAGMRF